MALPDRPPPLQWLPGFEAIARNGSVKKAAEELNVTSSALSQQIKSLETYLGIELLHRTTREVTLTGIGEFYLPLVQELLAAHRSAHESLKSRCERSHLRINMDPLVANELIIPRLAEFEARHPNTELRIETSMQNVDFERDSVDAAIRCAQSVGPGLHGELIHGCKANIILSPDLFDKAPLEHPEDLTHHTWITYTPAGNEWDMLFEFLNISKPVNKGMLPFDNIVSAVAAVEQGLGIMIGLFPLMEGLLESGKIVKASEQSMPIAISHYLVCRPNDKEREEIQQFTHWCREIFARRNGADADG